MYLTKSVISAIEHQNVDFINHSMAKWEWVAKIAPLNHLDYGIA